MRKKVGRNTIQDDKEFRTYNLRDCVVIHQCLKPMLKDLEEKGEGFKRAYYNESLPLLKPVGMMKENGINFDQKALKEFQKIVKKDVEEGDKEMRRILKISKAFNFNSSVELGYLLFGISPSKFKKISDLDFYSESTLPEGKRLRKKGTAIYEELKALKEPFTVLSNKNILSADLMDDVLKDSFLAVDANFNSCCILKSILTIC